jgi:peptidoglycan/xylan/chitin deacetylase (PgdA/CDA1 family)
MSADHSPQRTHERLLLTGIALVVGALAASLVPSTPPSSGDLAPAADSTSLATSVTGSTTTRSPFAVSPPTAEHAGLGESMRDGQIMTGTTAHRLILFTFDDGPDRRTTPLLLDRLDAAGVRAVFFLTGSRLGLDTPTLRQQSMIARDIRARGHIVASHTYDHLQLPLLNDEDVRYQITRAEDVFTQVFGARPWLIRPPGGGHSARVDAILAERGYTTVLWNIGAGDFQVRSANEVLDTWRRVYERLEGEGQRGGIVLLHDTYSWSVEAFQHIFNELQDRNCELLDRGQELFDIVDDPAMFYVPRDGRSPSTVAPSLVLTADALEQRQVKLRAQTTARCRSLAERL